MRARSQTVSYSSASKTAPSAKGAGLRRGPAASGGPSSTTHQSPSLKRHAFSRHQQQSNTKQSSSNPPHHEDGTTPLTPLCGVEQEPLPVVIDIPHSQQLHANHKEEIIKSTEEEDGEAAAGGTAAAVAATAAVTSHYFHYQSKYAPADEEIRRLVEESASRVSACEQMHESFMTSVHGLKGKLNSKRNGSDDNLQFEATFASLDREMHQQQEGESCNQREHSMINVPRHRTRGDTFAELDDQKKTEVQQQRSLLGVPSSSSTRTRGDTFAELDGRQFAGSSATAAVRGRARGDTFADLDNNNGDPPGLKMESTFANLDLRIQQQHQEEEQVEGARRGDTSDLGSQKREKGKDIAGGATHLAVPQHRSRGDTFAELDLKKEQQREKGGAEGKQQQRSRARGDTFADLDNNNGDSALRMDSTFANLDLRIQQQHQEVKQPATPPPPVIAVTEEERAVRNGDSGDALLYETTFSTLDLQMAEEGEKQHQSKSNSKKASPPPAVSVSNDTFASLVMESTFANLDNRLADVDELTNDTFAALNKNQSHCEVATQEQGGEEKTVNNFASLERELGGQKEEEEEEEGDNLFASLDRELGEQAMKDKNGKDGRKGGRRNRRRGEAQHAGANALPPLEDEKEAPPENSNDSDSPLPPPPALSFGSASLAEEEEEEKQTVVIHLDSSFEAGKEEGRDDGGNYKMINELLFADDIGPPITPRTKEDIDDPLL